jgi:hypothetical protein
MLKNVCVPPLLALVAMGLAAPAHADGDDVDGYLAFLQHEGIDTSARTSVIHMGRKVCDAFDHGLTEHTILSSLTSNTEYTTDEAVWIVFASVFKLRPEHEGDLHLPPPPPPPPPPS